MNPRPYSVQTLAERWGCSRRHVTNLIRRGELRAFRVGALLRITPEVVEAYECGIPMTQREASPQVEALEI